MNEYAFLASALEVPGGLRLPRLLFCATAMLMRLHCGGSVYQAGRSFRKDIISGSVQDLQVYIAEWKRDFFLSLKYFYLSRKTSSTFFNT